MLEQWSVGPITPPLQYSTLCLPYFHVPTVDPFTGERTVIDILRHAEKQSMAPHKMRRGVIGDHAHRLRKHLLALRRIEGLTLRRKQLVQFRIRVTNARRGAGFKVLRERGAGIHHAATTHIVKRHLAD